MIYACDITTPANTIEADALLTSLFVTKGLIYKIEIDFPPGAVGLHSVAVFDGAYQVWPSTPNIYFHTDGTIISFDDLYLKEIPPFKFTVKTFNLDTLYEHFVQVRVGFVSKEEYKARFLPGMAMESFEEMLSKILDDQDSRRLYILKQPFTWVDKK